MRNRDIRLFFDILVLVKKVLNGKTCQVANLNFRECVNRVSARKILLRKFNDIQ